LKKKYFAILIALSLAASMGTGVFAGSKLQEIKAYLNHDIKIVVNGTAVQLTNQNGKPVVPISYDNTTYLPVRAVSEALGVAVSFDAATNTVNLGEKVEGTSIAKGFDDMYHTKDPQYTTYQGKDYKEVYYNSASGDRSSSFMLYPKKQYQKLYLQIAAIGENIEKFEIKDAEGSTVLKTVDVIKPEDGLVTIEVDISGFNSLYVNGNAKNGGAVFVPLTTSYYR